MHSNKYMYVLAAFLVNVKLDELCLTNPLPTCPFGFRHDGLENALEIVVVAAVAKARVAP